MSRAKPAADLFFSIGLAEKEPDVCLEEPDSDWGDNGES
jgi:hypothetical protein